MTLRFELQRWFLLILLFSGCASRPEHFCTDKGQPAREVPAAYLIGDKQCFIKKDRDGTLVKHGPYREWFPNGAPAVEGEYSEGRKSGKWIEWDESGKKLSERWFEDGVETPTRNTKAASRVPTQRPDRKLR